MNRISVARRPKLSRSSSWTDYLKEYVTYVTQGGVMQTAQVQTTYGTQPAEVIAPHFAGIVQGAYKGNGVVFACMLARMLAFTEAHFAWRVPGGEGVTDRIFTDDALEPLEHPWPGGVTGDLLARMIQDADLAGQFYGTQVGNELVRLQPDKVQILLRKREHPDGGQVGWQRKGYLYREDANAAQVFFLPEEVAHFAPIPDPNASFRGMSWLTPVLREVQADSGMTQHKQKFLDQGSTPNLVVRLDPSVDIDNFRKFKEVMEEENEGLDNAYKNLYVGGGADVTVVGANLRQLDFKNTQGAGETRIAAAAGVPPVIVGLSEGLQAATYSNYHQAMRRYADLTIRPLWRNASSSLQMIVPAIEARARLCVDDRHIAFLREDARNQSEITGIDARAIRTLTEAGYDADESVRAVLSGDLSGLVGKHSGLFSVQLQKPGAGKPVAAPISGEE